ncbi:MAG TPA: glutamine synthetase family protein [Solirubrobacteraceae bacterium]
MTATDSASNHRLAPAAAATAGLDDRDAIARVTSAIESGEVREVEVMWVDHQGHARGKRINASSFLDRARRAGFAFCNASLTWDVAGDVKAGLRHADWDTGFPDFFAVPDLDTFRLLPWREGAGHVISDLVDHHGELVFASPRTVLRRTVDRLAALGYTARVGVEIEFHLLGEDETPLSDGLQAYSLQVLNQLEPAVGGILDGLRSFVELEGGNFEYGPAQCEINLRHLDALAAGDQAARFKYATRELARRHGALATFMAKPFGEVAGNSMHLHLSLWRDGEPAFAPDGEAENGLMRTAIGGILEHLPGIVLYGAPTVNSYKRFEVASFAPASATWGGDNRTVAIRSLIETPEATRIELRAGAADAHPHWAIAALLAAAIAGIEQGADPGRRGEGDLYRAGTRLPATLADGIAAARADSDIVEILGEDAVHDYLALAQAEWETFVSAVTEWDRERYLRSV